MKFHGELTERILKGLLKKSVEISLISKDIFKAIQKRFPTSKNKHYFLVHKCGEDFLKGMDFEGFRGAVLEGTHRRYSKKVHGRSCEGTSRGISDFLKEHLDFLINF